MNRTNIEWVKNPDGTQGYTWNPITGCLNHTDGLCKGGGFPCYAYKLAHGRLKSRYLANDNAPYGDKISIDYKRDPFYPRYWVDRLWQPARQSEGKKKSLGIFPCDMGELFGDWLPEEWQRSIFKVIRACGYHRFYLLTKQPQNLAKFSPFPDNCWVGVTACNFEMMDDALLYLGEIEAKVKYVSIEPFLGEIPEPYYTFRPEVDWLIIGAQTKPYKPPQIEWAKEIVEAADRAGIPVFLKDNLWGALQLEEWVWDGDKLRQEMPDGNGNQTQ